MFTWSKSVFKNSMRASVRFSAFLLSLVAGPGVSFGGTFRAWGMGRSSTSGLAGCAPARRADEVLGSSSTESLEVKEISTGSGLEVDFPVEAFNPEDWEVSRGGVGEFRWSCRV